MLLSRAMLLLSNTHKKLDFAHILRRIHSKMSFSYSKTIKESVKKYAHTLIHHKIHF